MESQFAVFKFEAKGLKFGFEFVDLVLGYVNLLSHAQSTLFLGKLIDNGFAKVVFLHTPSLLCFMAQSVVFVCQ